MTKLTPKQVKFKIEVERVRKKIHSEQRYLAGLIEHCGKVGHVIVPRDSSIMEKLKKDMWASTGALCAVCGKSFGWWCPKSPDHICHYSKSEDDCDYCHMPSERK